MKYLSVFTHPSTCPLLMNNTEHINHFQPDKAAEVSRGSSSSLMKRVTERRSKTLAEPHCTKECSMSSPSHNIKEQTQESDGRNATRTSFAHTSDFTWYQRIRLWETNPWEIIQAYIYRASFCVFYITGLQCRNQSSSGQVTIRDYSSSCFLSLPFFSILIFLMKWNSFSSKMHSTQSSSGGYSGLWNRGDTDLNPFRPRWNWTYSPHIMEHFSYHGIFV